MRIDNAMKIAAMNGPIMPQIPAVLVDTFSPGSLSPISFSFPLIIVLSSRLLV